MQFQRDIFSASSYEDLVKFLSNNFLIFSLCLFANLCLSMEAVTQNIKTLRGKFHRLCEIIEPDHNLLFAEYYQIRRDILKLPDFPFGTSFNEFVKVILSSDLSLPRSGFSTKYLARNGSSFSIFFFAALYCQYFGGGKLLVYNANPVNTCITSNKLPKSSVDPLLFAYRTTRGEKLVTFYSLIDAILEHAEILHIRLRFDGSHLGHLTEEEKIFEKNYHFLDDMLEDELFLHDLSYREVKVKNFLTNADNDQLAVILRRAIQQNKIDIEWVSPFIQSRK
jgi:hypothetical protein